MVIRAKEKDSPEAFVKTETLGKYFSNHSNHSDHVFTVRTLLMMLILSAIAAVTGSSTSSEPVLVLSISGNHKNLENADIENEGLFDDNPTVFFEVYRSHIVCFSIIEVRFVPYRHGVMMVLFPLVTL